MSMKPTIGILGGTGELGSGLAKRWLEAGFDVAIGSREAEKAENVVTSFNGSPGRASGTDNVAVARMADIIVVAVPWASHDTILSETAPDIAGKIVIDAVVPLAPPKVSVVQLPVEGSAAQRAQLLVPDALVVGAFHNVAAAKLHEPGTIDCDVLVSSNHKEAREQTIALVDAAGMRGIDAGQLPNSAASEALTSILIGINRRYKVSHAGIRISGLP